MAKKGYIIGNISREDWIVLDNNNIDWYPDRGFGLNHRNAIIDDESEYHRALVILGRN